MTTATRTTIAIAAVLAIGVALALFQPWLLFVDEVATETLPVAIVEEPMAGDPTTDEPMADEPMADPMDGDVMAPDAETGPVVLATGTFTSRTHETSGTVALVELEDGDVVLTIEGLQTDNGPDLYVYLDEDAADADRDAYDDGLDLGRLRANIGDLVYDVPDDADLATLRTVVIWCDRFSVVFGTASLSPA